MALSKARRSLGIRIFNYWMGLFSGWVLWSFYMPLKTVSLIREGAEVAAFDVYSPASPIGFFAATEFLVPASIALLVLAVILDAMGVFKDPRRLVLWMGGVLLIGLLVVLFASWQVARFSAAPDDLLWHVWGNFFIGIGLYAASLFAAQKQPDKPIR